MFYYVFFAIKETIFLNFK